MAVRHFFVPLSNFDMKGHSFSAWRQLVLVVILGLGAHFSKNAMAPAEPILQQLGLSPVSYAMVTSAPVFGACLFPPFWGALCQRYQLTTLVLVPCGILMGQAILYGGLVSFAAENGSISFVSKSIISLGLLTLSTFRAGGEVVQHVTLARILPRGLTRAFVGLVICTHLTVMLCNFVIPTALTKPTGRKQVEGLLHVQRLLMYPSVAGVAAAIMLAFQGIGSPVCEHRLESQVSLLEDGRFHRCIASEISVKGERKADRSDWTGALLIMWAALTVGLLHSFQSIVNGLVVSFGVSGIVAGNAVGLSQLIALLVLPVVGFVGDFIGRRCLVIITSVLALCACSVLGLRTFVFLPSFAWEVSLGALAVSGVLAPVLSLALVPQNVSMFPMAYGILDMLKSIVQILLMMLFAFARTESSWRGAALLACGPAAVALAMACVLAVKLVDVAQSWRSCEGCSPRRALDPGS